MGRQLGWMFRNAGLNTVQLGLLAGQWKRPILDEFNAEWDMVAYDLGGMAPLHRILEIKDEAMTSWLKVRQPSLSHLLCPWQSLIFT